MEDSRPSVQDVFFDPVRPRDGRESALQIGMLSWPKGTGIDELIGAIAGLI